jgi:hypothetical protein
MEELDDNLVVDALALKVGKSVNFVYLPRQNAYTSRCSTETATFPVHRYVAVRMPPIDAFNGRLGLTVHANSLSNAYTIGY